MRPRVEISTSFFRFKKRLVTFHLQKLIISSPSDLLRNKTGAYINVRRGEGKVNLEGLFVRVYTDLRWQVLDG